MWSKAAFLMVVKTKNYDVKNISENRDSYRNLDNGTRC